MLECGVIKTRRGSAAEPSLRQERPLCLARIGPASVPVKPIFPIVAWKYLYKQAVTDPIQYEYLIVPQCGSPYPVSNSQHPPAQFQLLEEGSSTNFNPCPAWSYGLPYPGYWDPVTSTINWCEEVRYSPTSMSSDGMVG